jgi:hypothetical protein
MLPTLAKNPKLLANSRLVDAAAHADVDHRRRDPRPKSLSNMEK